MVHKHKLHKLTMARTLSKASGLFEFIDFCLSGMLANIHEYFNCCLYFYFLLNFSCSLSFASQYRFEPHCQ